MYHLAAAVILAAHHETNLQRQFGFTVTPKEGTALVIVVLVLIVWAAGRLAARYLF